MRTRHFARGRASAAWVLSLALAGCAYLPSRTPLAPNPAQEFSSEWQGRLNVTLQSAQPSSTSAGFLLRGNAIEGTLDLYSPLGITLARLQWSPEHVQLAQGSSTQYFTSLDALTATAVGTTLPIEAIFEWLQNRDVAAPGWLADLTKLEQGRLIAKRLTPLPEVTLRIQLN